MAFTKTKIVVVALSLIVVVALAVYSFKWLKIARYLEPGEYYISYFDQSVRGLMEDSRVNFRGADIGRVMRIEVAPDNRYIGVVVKLKLKEDFTKNTFAQLQAVPATGQVILDIERLKPDDKMAVPALKFTPPYPVIPSKPSDLQKALGGINVLVEKIEEVGGVGIFDQVRSTVKQVEIFFRGERMEAILAKVDKNLANLQNITGRVDKILAGGYVEDVLKESRNTLQGAQNTLRGVEQVMAQMELELKDLNLKAILGRTRSLLTEVQGTSENLRNATKSLDALADRLYQRPPDALFGKPAAGRFNE